ncbi:MAG: hypothetical protein JST58_08180 [Bacteroidetes bacterium]|jgi:hypothetical protein|nr:hypothetical protein [Bacteroidota bacterium]
MNKYFYIILLVAGSGIFSCKKIVQKQEQNAVLSIMTSGVWYMQSYKLGSADSTGSFSGYVFKFDQSGTVTATLGASASTGSWTANISNRSITSNFPGASNPLNKLNSTWTITDSGLTYVVANATIGDSTANMRLQKQ